MAGHVQPEWAVTFTGIRTYGISAKTAAALIDQVRQTVADHWRTCLARRGIGKAAINKLASSFVPEYFDA